MNEPTCGSCRFFLAMTPNGEEGVCRGSTPVPILLGHAPARLAGQMPDPVVRAYFPPMLSGGWCGRHEHKIHVSKIDMSKFVDVPAEGTA